MRKTNKEKIEEEFEQWKKETDKIREISSLLNNKSKKFYTKRRNDLIEELYVCQENGEVILSGGTMCWLYLGKDDLDKLVKRGQWRLYLEELKIRHRLAIFKIHPSNIDIDKVINKLNQPKTKQ
jgi:hypothetical protein